MGARELVTLALLVKVISTGAPASPQAALGRLSWLAGSWAGDSAEVRIEEHWTAPRAGMMLGMHRDVIRGRLASFEFLRIEADSTGVRYVSQPRGRPPTAFRLKELGDGQVTFENPAHDYPQRIAYWLDGDGALHARIEGRVKGRLEFEEWRWTRDRLDP